MSDSIEIPTTVASSEPAQNLVTTAHIAYACYAVGFLIGITWIVGVIIAYIKRGEATGTWLASHFSWQIRTFWWGLLWCVIAIPLSFVLIITVVGPFILFGIITIWLIYRVVRGWLLLSERKPTPA